MDIFNQAKKAAEELIEKSGIGAGDIAVIGCSTSEVIGEKIGTSGTVDVAQQIFDGLNSVFAEKGIYLAAQCCEHLNRAIIIEEEKAKAIGAEIIPAGTVIQQIRKTVPEFDYQNGGLSLCRDGFHLSFDYGRFTAAAVWLRTLTGKKIKCDAFEDFDTALMNKILEVVNSI